MVNLDGSSLTIQDVVRIARSRDRGWATDHEPVSLAEDMRVQLQDIRSFIETNWLHPSASAVYGFNTGVGKLKDQSIPLSEILTFQRALLKSHSAGVGEPLPEDAVRATMLLRSNSLAKGHSGVRPETLDRLLAMLNAGIHPVIPCKGSVGASGDLAPLAFLAAALVGDEHSEVYFEGHRVPAQHAFRQAGLPSTFEIRAKEGLALINGTSVSLALGVLAWNDALECTLTADIAMAMGLEAIRGELAAFDERLHHARPHQGQLATARNIRLLLKGTRRCSPGARQSGPSHLPATAPSERIQDSYSFRCAPQVHGPSRDALNYVRDTLAIEINSATDNPLVFRKNQSAQSLEALSGGNFHGQYVAQAMDLVAIAVTDLASISERRAACLLDPSMSYGLPINLVAHTPGVNTGYSIAHSTMSALVTENKTLCWPASVDSIPTKNNQEDHVSNSTWCARKANMVVDNARYVQAIELLIAAQALSLAEQSLDMFPLGRGTSAALGLIREVVPTAIDGDRWLHDDIQALLPLVRGGHIRLAVERAIGECLV